MFDTVKTYYRLVKPGIIYGNALTLISGFLFAAKDQINLSLLLAVLVGSSLIMASACVFNNYLDRKVDAKMTRTKKRALVTKTVLPAQALTYASALGVAGFGILSLLVNWPTVLVGAIGFVSYVLVYTPGKKRTVYGTLLGSIAGATPIVAGYVAVTSRFDTAAGLLFLIMAAWQVPHFYAIATYRYKDYKAATLPVWPIKKGLSSTKQQMLVYIAVFAFFNCLLAVRGYAGFSYLIVIMGLSLVWLWRAFKGFLATDDELWGRQMFGFSLIVLLVFCVMLTLNPVLP